jgi:hypothetical protein
MVEVPSTSTTTSNNNQQTQTQTYQNKEIESFIESNWITIKDRETKVFEFVPGKAKVVDKTDFNGKPVKKVQFSVIDINDERRKEKFFEVSRMHVSKIYDELKKGKTILEISRLGSGKDTRYFVKAVR